MNNPSRRRFLRQSSLGASALAVGSWPTAEPFLAAATPGQIAATRRSIELVAERALDLSPAGWIWYPSGRVLANTMVLFRRTVELDQPVRSARGWILGDSRYLLTVNGRRVQWGPAPSDPRFSEADPLDLTDHLRQGRNVLGAQVLYYGLGDGTWPIGKPGFIFLLDINLEDGSRKQIVSDDGWLAFLARSWRPGQYKRWFLRAFQEEFDARSYPLGWTDPDFATSVDWLPAAVTGRLADKPAVCSSIRDYLFESNGDPDASQLRRRQIPMLIEKPVEGARLEEAHLVTWKRPPEEYFESLTPDAYLAEPATEVTSPSPGVWRVDVPVDRAVALTFSFPEQIVGWPYFSIDAPEGTVVELMPHEAHRAGGPAILNTRFHSWSRFICREGKNRFETFDYESLRWMQLHIRNASGPVEVEQVGVRRRLHPWENTPRFDSSDAGLNRLFGAGINTLLNCAQETIVDCMGRERQQYSGDLGHVIHATTYAFGDRAVAARYVDTFSQGLTNSGYYLDCWPAYDRLARLPEREMQLTQWGPLLDHGVGHVFDCYHYYMYTGDLDALAEAYPRHQRFLGYLRSIRQSDGLIPVDDLGTPWVWIDHDAYQAQRHKICAFNLYVAGMMTHAFPVLARAFGDADLADEIAALGASILRSAQEAFWSPSESTYVVNRPWLAEEGAPRYCDRSLAQAVLFRQCPNDDIAASVAILANAPPEMGFSYPANAGWRLWALVEAGRIDVVLDELRNRWGAMRSVLENNSLSEVWEPGYDGTDQWSHGPVAPVYLMYQGLAGLAPLTPGYADFVVRPQFGDLERCALVAYTERGPIDVQSEGRAGDRRLRITPPADTSGHLVIDARETPGLQPSNHPVRSGLSAWTLPGGQTTEILLRYT